MATNVAKAMHDGNERRIRLVPYPSSLRASDNHETQRSTTISPTRDALSAGGPLSDPLSEGAEHRIRVEDALIAAAETAARSLLATRSLPVSKYPFALAQQLKAVPFADALVETDDTALRPAVAAFCRVLYAAPHDAYQDEDFSPDGAETFWLAVVAVWSKVNTAGGALATAVEAARRAPLVLLPPLDRKGAAFRWCMSAAYQLQRHVGDAPVYLPCRLLAVRLGLSWTRVASLLEHGVRHDLLRLVEPTWSYKARKAKTYRFNLDSPLYLAPDAAPSPLPAHPCGACGASLSWCDDWPEPGRGAWLCFACARGR
jgi:hypothetical protein